MAAMTGRIARVNGPLIEVAGLREVAMFDVVELGPRQLLGEVVAIRGEIATVQAYEYTGGLTPDDPVRTRGEPLSVPLGPGLLGGVFDGLLRPLSGAPTWLEPGATRAGASAASWRFEPSVSVGTAVESGSRIGAVQDGPVPYAVLTPLGVAGTVEKISPAGGYDADAVVATVDGVDISLTTFWPVRRARPYRSRLDSVAGLHTGQRVIDHLYPIALGSTAGVPGGFGTGKTVLLQQLAKWCDADVVVYVGCGERGNEMADVVAELAALEDPRTGGRLAQRMVVRDCTSFGLPNLIRIATQRPEANRRLVDAMRELAPTHLTSS